MHFELFHIDSHADRGADGRRSETKKDGNVAAQKGIGDDRDQNEKENEHLTIVLKKPLPCYGETACTVRMPENPFLSLFALVIFVQTALFAQETPPQQPAPPQVDFLRLMRSPMMQRTQQASGRTTADAMWNGNGGNLMAIQLVDEPEIREAWGITDEQHQQIKGVVTNSSLFMNHPDFQNYAAELGKFMKPDDIYMEKATPEQLDGFTAGQEKLVGLAINAFSAEIGNVLTEEQNQQLLEFQLAAMSEMPIALPASFEALGLSEEQKKQMEDIRKEFEDDFNTMIDESMTVQFDILQKVYEKMAEDKVEIQDPNALQEKIMGAVKDMEDVMKTDENIRRKTEEIQKKGQAFMTRFKFKVFDILTDEQMAKLENLVDHPPEYVKTIMKRLLEKQGLGSEPGVAPNFMNAWKPGDPIPERYREERQKRRPFPQKEKE